MNLIQEEIEPNTYKVNISVENLNIKRDDIGLNLGYSDGTIPSYFCDMIDEIISQLPNLCEIETGYHIVDVDNLVDKKNGLNVGGLFLELDRIVTSQLKKSEQAALFLCTIGDKMERLSKELLTEGDPTKSFIVNDIASATAENAANLLHDFIGNKMNKKELGITNRYSPGYCNWSVTEQHLLFSLFPENFCGVKLNKSALMWPIKSVSGIIGIGKEVKWREYICDTCGVKDCTHRIKRLEKMGK